MLSILIPTFNYNVAPLVDELYKQTNFHTDLEFEIIVYDDGSKLFHSENNEINKLSNCSYSILEKNIGRSAIRNKLATDAKYENLLFLDADVRIISENFITEYLNRIKNNPKFEVIYGGIVYQSEKPNQNQLLRWIYGNEREALSAEVRNADCYVSFLTLNFLIKKKVFNQVRFNETIPNLRYEDLLFSFDLMHNEIKIEHINNQVVHNGIETSEVFLEKTNSSLHGLKYLLDHQIIDYNYAKISRTFIKLKSFKLLFLIRISHNLFQKKYVKNLLGKQPNLFFYDIYRLGYFCNINN